MSFFIILKSEQKVQIVHIGSGKTGFEQVAKRIKKRIGIVPASDTGAMEMALWSLLGAGGVEMLAWESFGAGWVADVAKQLKLDAVIKTAEYGRIVDLASVDFNNDVVFTWNGTTS
ncbi:MAG: hypothetical protein L3J16_06325, partial [Anaerolineales bacterium]|nr:hypothetical protein [Anaerolineales bacterium]